MKSINDFHTEIEKWHIEALTAFTLYQQTRIAAAQNRDYIGIMQNYAGVFHPMLNSSRIASFSNLTKIFIGYKNKKTGKSSLSLDFLLQELEKAQSLSNFDINYHAKLKNKLKSNGKIKELRRIRNQQVAHIDLSPEATNFSDKDFKDLLGLSNEILIFSNWCINDNDQSEGYYQTLANDVGMELRRLLNTLKISQDLQE